ncbi:MAG: gliding motility-associated C-terminal domain-containing protein [Bacteroidetes bacterium]|nr:gliding motility-associated C-terminal domain-containing protein [Bacteroidota bacterium]
MNRSTTYERSGAKKLLCICSFFCVFCFAKAQPCTLPTVTVLEKIVCQNENIHLTFTGTPPFSLDYTFNGTRRTVTVSGMSTTLAATQPGANMFVVNELVDGKGCSTGTPDENGVKINGIIWAKYNVDAPNTFAENPEDAGMFYQWNSKVGWSTTNPAISTDGSVWNDDWDWDWNGNNAATWETANNICPEGWRIPTPPEQESLVSAGSTWQTRNGKRGLLFGNGDNTVFLPNCYFRFGSNFLTSDSYYDATRYWSNTRTSPEDNTAHYIGLGILNQVHATNGSWMYCAQPVRCVKDTQTDTVTVHPTKQETITKVICSNESYFFNGTNYNQTGIYTDTLKTSFGCDSIVTLKLTVNPAFDLQESITICENELPFTFRDIVFGTETVSGQYTFNRKTVNGCDSITTLILTVNPTFDLQETIILCDAIFPFTFRDITFEAGTAEGTYVFNRSTVTGCDSTVTLNLTYNTNFTEQITLCDSKLPFTFRDITFEVGTQSGDYVFTRKSLYNCDSIVTLKLTVNETFTTYDTITLYDDDLPFTYLGMTFSHGSYSGDYVFPRKTVSGCDSIIHLNLTIYQILRQTICESELPTFIRDTWFPQGTQSDVYMVDNGLTTLILTVNPTPEFTIGNPDAILKMLYTRPQLPIDTAIYNNGNNNNTILKGADIISCTNAEYENIVAGNFSPPFNASASLQWTIIYENGDRYTLPDKTLQTLLADTALFPYVGAYRIEALYQYQSNGRVCASATTIVDYAVFDPPHSPIVATQKTMCEGELTSLQAFGSPLIQWISSDKKLHNWTGETYDFDRLGQSDIPVGTYEFELYDIDTVSGCKSERVQTSFEVTPAANSQIIGRNEFCLQAIEEQYAIKTAAQGSEYFWKTSGTHYNYSKDGNPYSPNRYVDWYGVGIDTLSVYERTYAGCEGYDTLVVFIADYPQPFYTWSLPSASTTIEFTDNSYQAPIVVKNPDGTYIEIPLTYTMEWFFDTADNRDTLVVDMFVNYFDRFKPIQIHDYTYGFKYPILTVTNNFGCRASYATEIFVDILNGIYIPNAFSPTNAAASVQIFKPVAYNLEYCKVWIYDKWGNLLWYSNEVQNGTFTGAWDGTHNGELLQSDVYIWKMEAKFLNGTTWAGQKKSLGGYSKFGSVVLIR